MQLELERGGNAEVAASAAQAPEEVGVLFGARRHRLPVGGHEIDGAQVVDGQAMFAHHPANPAPQG